MLADQHRCPLLLSRIVPGQERHHSRCSVLPITYTCTIARAHTHSHKRLWASDLVKWLWASDPIKRLWASDLVKGLWAYDLVKWLRASDLVKQTPGQTAWATDLVKGLWASDLVKWLWASDLVRQAGLANLGTACTGMLDLQLVRCRTGPSRPASEAMVVRLLTVTQATSWTEPKSRVGPTWGSVLKHPFPSRTGQGYCVLGSYLDYPLLLIPSSTASKP